MNKSESIANLAAALSRAQKEMPHIKFDAKNPFLGNKYASLGAVVDASIPVMARFGLSIAQFPTSTESQPGREGQIGVTTILMHESGEFIEESVLVTPETKKGLSINQSSGVTITYLRRYAWAAVLGLVAEEDTDGDDNTGTIGNAEADAKVKAIMASRNWTPTQTEALSKTALDADLEGLNYDEAVEILNLSALPESAPATTIASWFKHYIKSSGTTPLTKAADANDAYIKAKKNGGK